MMSTKKAFWFFGLGLIVLLFLFGCAKKPIGEGNQDFSINHDGLRRTYTVHVPNGYDKETPMPVVLAFHGGGGTGQAMRELTGLDQKADQEGFIVVYPDGTGKQILGKTSGSWNGGGCCPPASKENVDDVGFIEAMIEQLEKDFSVDEKRIYATGHSNGAIISYRLACELSDKIAAIAPLGAQGVYTNCNPSRPVPIMHMHGTADNCAKFEGGTCGGCFEKFLRDAYGINIEEEFIWACMAVPAQIQEWVNRNGVTGSPQTTFQNGDATCQTWGQNQEGEITLCTIEGLGHTWPNGSYGAPCAGGMETNTCKKFREIVGEKTDDISANDKIWEFFEQHSLK